MPPVRAEELDQCHTITALGSCRGDAASFLAVEFDEGAVNVVFGFGIGSIGAIVGVGVG